MKHFRIWLLLLLAVLLPVRGALAAAMLCPPAGVGTQTELRVLDHHVGHHAAMEEASVVVHDHAAHTHGLTAHDEHGSSGATDKCNLCTAFCSVTPLVSSSAVMLAPQDLNATTFPAVPAPAPSFLSDGQERPPRSI